MSVPELNDDFVDLLVEFAANGVEFLVVSAHALAVHGVARATGDFDLFVRPTRPNAERVLAALRAFGAPVDAHGLSVDLLAQGDMVYQIGLPPRRIDLLTSISGCGFDDIWPRRVNASVAGLSVPVIGRADLITNKRASHRDKDLLDLALLAESQTAD